MKDKLSGMVSAIVHTSESILRCNIPYTHVLLQQTAVCSKARNYVVTSDIYTMKSHVCCVLTIVSFSMALPAHSGLMPLI
jgi:hypothetical protein